MNRTITWLLVMDVSAEKLVGLGWDPFLDSNGVERLSI
jgi:hypothetical protein